MYQHNSSEVAGEGAMHMNVGESNLSKRMGQNKSVNSLYDAVDCVDVIPETCTMQ